MEKIIDIIKARIEECKETGEMFSLPRIDGGRVIDRELPCDGTTLLHTEYEIAAPDGGTITIDYQSKDKCRSFQVNPDRSYIEVKCSDPQYDFTDSWDENN